MGFEAAEAPRFPSTCARASRSTSKCLPLPGAWNKVGREMKRTIQESVLSVFSRFSGALPAVWMLLVLLIFLAIRVLGSHFFQSLHLFRKAL